VWHTALSVLKIGPERRGWITGTSGQAAAALTDLNFEETAIRVLMAPTEILLLFAPPHSVEITIVAMLLPEIRAVCPILVVVPSVVVVASPVVVASFMMVPVASSRYDGADQRSA